MKRDDVLSWDQYFMAVAHLSALRSKDPNTRVGACIVNPEKRIVGLGYNGFPMGCDDDVYSWEREGEYLDTKYPYVVHAELNAILNSIQNLKGCTLYVSLFPCNECAKAIIQHQHSLCQRPLAGFFPKLVILRERACFGARRG